ncbi:hypothetical protein ACFYTS_34010 [Nocardia sp. NPDC004151]|uniref:hypothetical protein n=1 Tax=Nocardia sp. NPDC004151 TaxID=3364304 RepID=UPI00369B7EBB
MRKIATPVNPEVYERISVFIAPALHRCARCALRCIERSPNASREVRVSPRRRRGTSEEEVLAELCPVLERVITAHPRIAESIMAPGKPKSMWLVTPGSGMPSIAFRRAWASGRVLSGRRSSSWLATM